MQEWALWALASAVFAALTAIFAKVGLEGIDSDYATFIRTLVIAAALILFLTYAKKWQPLGELGAQDVFHLLELEVGIAQQGDFLVLEFNGSAGALEVKARADFLGGVVHRVAHFHHVGVAHRVE